VPKPQIPQAEVKKNNGKAKFDGAKTEDDAQAAKKSRRHAGRARWRYRL
jgi:hypothetical protein